MSNKHVFQSVLTEKKIFESKKVDKRVFSSVINTIKYFTSIIDGFTPSDTWFGRFIANQRISVSKINSSVKYNARVIFNDLVISVSDVLTTLNVNPKIRFLQESAMRVVMTMTQKMGDATFRSISNFNPRMTDKLNVKSTQFLSTEIIGVSLVAKKYYLLSYYSGSMVSVMDSTNLSDLDYQVV
jgi:hypothetical protein